MVTAGEGPRRPLLTESYPTDALGNDLDRLLTSTESTREAAQRNGGP
jgi:hypothetical protein